MLDHKRMINSPINDIRIFIIISKKTNCDSRKQQNRYEPFCGVH